MALPKPEKSKAPAIVQPEGMWHGNGGVTDPCCIPSAAGSFDPLLAVSGEVGTGDPGSPVAQILTPNGH